MPSQRFEDYQRRYPYLKLSHELKKQWLEQLQEKKDWQTIIAHADKLPNDNASQCIILEAKAAIEKTTKPHCITNLINNFK